MQFLPCIILSAVVSGEYCRYEIMLLRTLVETCDLRFITLIYPTSHFIQVQKAGKKCLRAGRGLEGRNSDDFVGEKKCRMKSVPKGRTDAGKLLASFV